MATILIKAIVNRVPAMVAIDVDTLNWVPMNAAAHIEPDTLPTKLFELQVATDKGMTGVSWDENLHNFVFVNAPLVIDPADREMIEGTL